MKKAIPFSKFEQIEAAKLKKEGVVFANDTDVLAATIKQIIKFFLKLSQGLSSFIFLFQPVTYHSYSL